MKEQKKKKEDDLKSVKVLKDAHKKAKVHVAKTGGNMTNFISEAILEKLSN